MTFGQNDAGETITAEQQAENLRGAARQAAARPTLDAYDQAMGTYNQAMNPEAGTAVDNQAASQALNDAADALDTLATDHAEVAASVTFGQNEAGETITAEQQAESLRGAARQAAAQPQIDAYNQGLNTYQQAMNPETGAQVNYEAAAEALSAAALALDTLATEHAEVAASMSFGQNEQGEAVTVQQQAGSLREGARQAGMQQYNNAMDAFNEAIEVNSDLEAGIEALDGAIEGLKLFERMGGTGSLEHIELLAQQKAMLEAQQQFAAETGTAGQAAEVAQPAGQAAEAAQPTEQFAEAAQATPGINSIGTERSNEEQNEELRQAFDDGRAHEDGEVKVEGIRVRRFNVEGLKDSHIGFHNGQPSIYLANEADLEHELLEMSLHTQEMRKLGLSPTNRADAEQYYKQLTQERAQELHDQAKALEVAVAVETSAPTVYQKDTARGRNRDVNTLLASPIFADVTGIDLMQGTHVVIDIGVGGLPLTTADMAEGLKSRNSGVRVIGTELPSATAMAHITSQGLLDAFRQEIAHDLQTTHKMNIGAEQISDLRLVVDSNGRVIEAIVGTDDNNAFKTFAVAEGVAFTGRKGEKTDEAWRKTNTLNRMIDFLGGQGVLNSLIDQGIDGATDNRGTHIELNPIAKMLEASGGEFVSTENPARDISEKASVVTVNNVTMHMDATQKADFMDMLKGALKENGIVIVKNKIGAGITAIGRNAISVYQLSNGELRQLDGHISSRNDGSIDASESFLGDHLEARQESLNERFNALIPNADNLGEQQREQINIACDRIGFFEQWSLLTQDISITDEQFEQKATALLENLRRQPELAARATEDYGWQGGIDRATAERIVSDATYSSRGVTLPTAVQEAIESVLGPQIGKDGRERYGSPDIRVVSNDVMVDSEGQAIEGPVRLRYEAQGGENIVISSDYWDRLRQGDVEAASALAHELMAAFVVAHNMQHAGDAGMQIDGEEAHDMARTVEHIILANALNGPTPMLATDARIQDNDYRALQYMVDSLAGLNTELGGALARFQEIHELANEAKTDDDNERQFVDGEDLGASRFHTVHRIPILRDEVAARNRLMTAVAAVKAEIARTRQNLGVVDSSVVGRAIDGTLDVEVDGVNLQEAMSAQRDWIDRNLQALEDMANEADDLATGQLLTMMPTGAEQVEQIDAAREPLRLDGEAGPAGEKSEYDRAVERLQAHRAADEQRKGDRIARGEKAPAQDYSFEGPAATAVLEAEDEGIAAAGAAEEQAAGAEQAQEATAGKARKIEDTTKEWAEWKEIFEGRADARKVDDSNIPAAVRAGQQPLTFDQAYDLFSECPAVSTIAEATEDEAEQSEAESTGEEAEDKDEQPVVAEAKDEDAEEQEGVKFIGDGFVLKYLQNSGVIDEARALNKKGDKIAAAALVNAAVKVLLDVRSKTGEPLSYDEAFNLSQDLFSISLEFSQGVDMNVGRLTEIQQKLLRAFKDGYVGCASTSAGKTYVNLIEGLIHKMIAGEDANVMIVLEKDSAITNYFGENDSTLVEFGGLRLVNGDELYEKGKDNGGDYSELSEALKDNSAVVIFTYGQHAFLMNNVYDIGNRELMEAVRSVNVKRIDEIDKFALSKDMYIVSGETEPPSEERISKIGGLHAELTSMVETGELVPMSEEALLDVHKKAQERERDTTDDRGPPVIAYCYTDDGQMYFSGDAIAYFTEKGYTPAEMSSVMRAIHQSQTDEATGTRRMEGKRNGYKVTEVDGKQKICPVGDDGLVKESSNFQDVDYSISLALSNGLEPVDVVEVGVTTTGATLLEMVSINPDADVTGAAGTEFSELLKAMLGKDTAVIDKSTIDMGESSTYIDGVESADISDIILQRHAELRVAAEADNVSKHKRTLILEASIYDKSTEHGFSERFVDELVGNIVTAYTDGGVAQMVYLGDPALNALVKEKLAERLAASGVENPTGLIDEINSTSSGDDITELAENIFKDGPRIIITNEAALIGTDYVGQEIDSHIVADEMTENLAAQAIGRTSRKKGNTSVATLYLDTNTIAQDLAMIEQFGDELRNSWNPRLKIGGERFTITNPSVVRGDEASVTLVSESGREFKAIVNVKTNTIVKYEGDSILPDMSYTALGDIAAFALLEEYTQDVKAERAPFSSRSDQDQKKFTAQLKFKYRAAAAKSSSIEHSISEALEGHYRQMAKVWKMEAFESDQAGTTEGAGEVLDAALRELLGQNTGVGDVGMSDQYVSGEDRLKQIIDSKTGRLTEFLSDLSGKLDELANSLEDENKANGVRALKAKVDAELAEMQGLDASKIDADDTKDWAHSTSFSEKVAVSRTLENLLLPSRASREQAQQQIIQTQVDSASKGFKQAQQLLEGKKGKQPSTQKVTKAADTYESSAASLEKAANDLERTSKGNESSQQTATSWRAQAQQSRAQAERLRASLATTPEEGSAVTVDAYRDAAAHYTAAADHYKAAADMLDTQQADEETKKSVNSLRTEEKIMHYNESLQMYSACMATVPEGQTEPDEATMQNAVSILNSGIRVLRSIEDRSHQIGSRTVEKGEGEEAKTEVVPITVAEKLVNLTQERDRLQTSIRVRSHQEAYNEAMELYNSCLTTSEDGQRQELAEGSTAEDVLFAIDEAIGALNNIKTKDRSHTVERRPVMEDGGQGFRMEETNVDERIAQLTEQRDKMQLGLKVQPHLDAYNAAMDEYGSFFLTSSEDGKSYMKQDARMEDLVVGIDLAIEALENIDSGYVLGQNSEGKDVTAADEIASLTAERDSWQGRIDAQAQMDELLQGVNEQSEAGHDHLQAGEFDKSAKAFMDAANKFDEAKAQDPNLNTDENNALADGYRRNAGFALTQLANEEAKAAHDHLQNDNKEEAVEGYGTAAAKFEEAKKQDPSLDTEEYSTIATGWTSTAKFLEAQIQSEEDTKAQAKLAGEAAQETPAKLQLAAEEDAHATVPQATFNRLLDSAVAAGDLPGYGLDIGIFYVPNTSLNRLATELNVDREKVGDGIAVNGVIFMSLEECMNNDVTRNRVLQHELTEAIDQQVPGLIPKAGAAHAIAAQDVEDSLGGTLWQPRSEIEPVSLEEAKENARAQVEEAEELPAAAEGGLSDPAEEFDSNIGTELENLRNNNADIFARARNAIRQMEIREIFLADEGPDGSNVYMVTTKAGDHYMAFISKGSVIGLAVHEGQIDSGAGKVEFKVLPEEAHPEFARKMKSELDAAKQGQKKIAMADRTKEYGSERRTPEKKAGIYLPAINFFYGADNLKKDYIGNSILRQVAASLRPETVTANQDTVLLVQSEGARDVGAIAFKGHTAYGLHSLRTRDVSSVYHLQTVVHEFSHERFGEMDEESQNALRDYFLNEGESLARVITSSPRYANLRGNQLVSEMIAHIMGALTGGEVEVARMGKRFNRLERAREDDELDWQSAGIKAGYINILVKYGFLPRMFGESLGDNMDTNIDVAYLEGVYPQAKKPAEIEIVKATISAEIKPTAREVAQPKTAQQAVADVAYQFENGGWMGLLVKSGLFRDRVGIPKALQTPLARKQIALHLNNKQTQENINCGVAALKRYLELSDKKVVLEELAVQVTLEMIKHDLNNGQVFFGLMGEEKSESIPVPLSVLAKAAGRYYGVEMQGAVVTGDISGVKGPSIAHVAKTASTGEKLLDHVVVAEEVDPSSGSVKVTETSREKGWVGRKEFGDKWEQRIILVDPASLIGIAHTLPTAYQMNIGVQAPGGVFTDLAPAPVLEDVGGRIKDMLDDNGISGEGIMDMKGLGDNLAETDGSA